MGNLEGPVPLLPPTIVEVLDVAALVLAPFATFAVARWQKRNHLLWCLLSHEITCIYDRTMMADRLCHCILICSPILVLLLAASPTVFSDSGEFNALSSATGLNLSSGPVGKAPHSRASARSCARRKGGDKGKASWFCSGSGKSDSVLPKPFFPQAFGCFCSGIS